LDGTTALPEMLSISVESMNMPGDKA
jgi:hypothetical protein